MDKVGWTMLFKIWKRIRASDTDSGEDGWFVQGMVNMRLWISGRDPGLDLGLVAGDCGWEGIDERSSMFGARDS